MTYDAAAFGALALALTVLGGVVTWFRWRRRGLPALLRGTAWSLLPLAAWLTGVLRLAVQVASAVGDWAARLVFSPTVWVGIVLAGAAAMLFVVSGMVGPAVRKGPERRSVTTRATPAKARGEEDLDDIEAILRKHGIS